MNRLSIPVSNLLERGTSTAIRFSEVPEQPIAQNPDIERGDKSDRKKVPKKIHKVKTIKRSNEKSPPRKNNNNGFWAKCCGSNKNARNYQDSKNASTSILAPEKRN